MSQKQWWTILASSYAGMLVLFVLWTWACVTIGR
jgi:hypothetical protein